MTAPISFTVRPPSSSAPYRPSPLANGSRTNSRIGPPSRRLFENGDHSSDEEDDRPSRRSESTREDQKNGRSNGSGSGYVLIHGQCLSSSDTHRSSKPSAPLVIPALPNRDWRESSNRKVPTFKPEAPVKQESDLGTHERIGDGTAKSGLERFGKKREIEPEVKLEEGMDVDIPQVKKEPLTLEQQALEELMAGETEKESAEDRAQRELVISMQSDNFRTMSETEALKRDMNSLPSESTLEDFEAVPISAFGIAALRGMGWDQKSTENVKAREVVRRPQLLGLGATPLEVTLPPGSGKSRKELEREKEKREKKKSREEKTGRGFSAASLLMKQPTPSGSTSGSVRQSRAGSVETGTDSDGSRRRRREDEGGSERESKRRDGRDRDRDEGRFETEEERARRKARERERDDGRYETEEERTRRKARERERDRGDRSRGR
jgi:hypothetical protein